MKRTDSIMLKGDLGQFFLMSKVGVVIIGAYCGGRFANLLWLPKVSGYLAIGILLGEDVLNILGRHEVFTSLKWITDVSLCVIGFEIGGSLEFERLRRLGKSIFTITFSQAIGAFLFSAIGILGLLLGFRAYLPFHLETANIVALSTVTGAISVATAPGTVMAVISESGARGSFTDTLLGVVALDDGVTLVVFALAIVCVQLLLPGGGAVSWSTILPLWELFGSVVVGLALAICCIFGLRNVYDRGSLLMVSFGVLVLIAGLSSIWHLSSILTSMVFGCSIVNLDKGHNRFFQAIDPIEDTIFGLFFVLAGAHMDLGLITGVWYFSLGILVFRFLGKQVGVVIGSKGCRECDDVRRYLGLGLFPQAGVTIGLVLLASQQFEPHVGEFLVNFILGSVVLNEIISPPLLKWTFLQVGEGHVQDTSS